MKNPISLQDYYLWKRDIETKYPWNRQFINWEFLNFERKRIEKLQEWYKKFQKSNQTSQVLSVQLYVVPIEINSYWRSAIAELGFTRFVGLSAFPNSSQILVIALLTDQTKTPKQYSLIEIQNPWKSILYNRFDNLAIPVIIVEDWEVLSADSIYQDIPYEKGIVDKILKEGSIQEEQISLSFQSPILSAPYVQGNIGGISLSSLAGSSLFSKELITTLQMFVPPEYRKINPPHSVYKGVKFDYVRGIKFHLAERPQRTENVFSPIISKDEVGLEKEINQRKGYAGEYSIFSTILTREEGKTSVLKSMLLKLKDNEINIPTNLDEYVYSDIDLLRLRNNITEDVWGQVVSARNIYPGLDEKSDVELNKIIKLINQDVDIFLTEYFPQDTTRKYLTKHILDGIKENITRVSQSFARRDETKDLQKKHFMGARKLFVGNIESLLQNPITDIFIRAHGREYADKRYSIVATYLIDNPNSNVIEIFENVKNTDLYRDLADLQSLLDWMHRMGKVIKDINNRYTLI